MPRSKKADPADETSDMNIIWDSPYEELRLADKPVMCGNVEDIFGATVCLVSQKKQIPSKWFLQASREERTADS